MKITWAISSEYGKRVDLMAGTSEPVLNTKAIARVTAEFNLQDAEEYDLYTQLKEVAHKILFYQMKQKAKENKEAKDLEPLVYCGDCGAIIRTDYDKEKHTNFHCSRTHGET